MVGEKSASARRIISLLAYVSIVVIFVSGLFQGNTPEIFSVIGGVIAVAAWAYALVTAIIYRQTDWIIALVCAMILGGLFAWITLGDQSPDSVSIPQTGGLTLGFLAATYAVLGARNVVDRGTPAFTGIWALVTLVIGGTLVGGAIGTSIGAAAPYITAVGFHLYDIAAVMAIYSYVVGLILGVRVGAWGWFTAVLLLPAIGSFMFGLLGPTRQDVLMSQEQARARKAAGVN